MDLAGVCEIKDNQFQVEKERNIKIIEIKREKVKKEKYIIRQIKVENLLGRESERQSRDSLHSMASYPIWDSYTVMNLTAQKSKSVKCRVLFIHQKKY